MRVIIKFQSNPDKFHNEIKILQLLVGPCVGVVTLLFPYDIESIGIPNKTLGDKAYHYGMFSIDGNYPFSVTTK